MIRIIRGLRGEYKLDQLNEAGIIYVFYGDFFDDWENGELGEFKTITEVEIAIQENEVELMSISDV